MIVLDMQNLTMSFGAQEIFRDISLTVHEGERIGLTGANGTGKTTLLRVILGEHTPERGTVSVARGYSVGYLAQHHMAVGEHSVWQEAEAAFAPLFAVEEKLRETEKRMAEVQSEEELAALGEQYHRLFAAFEKAGGYGWHSRTMGVLKGLGLPEEYWEKPVEALSGGERTRLALARLLLNNHDVLLLDEPTNHLDLDAAQWLTDFLSRYSGTILLISHDRYMLDKLCTSIAQLDNKKLYRYNGNYSAYCTKRAEAVRSQQKQFEEQQEEIQRQQEIIKRFRSYNREKSIRAAESREKALERMEKVEKPEENKAMRLDFFCKRTPGQEILSLENVNKSFGTQKLFENINEKVFAGERIALLGSNGAGKTTLLKILLNKQTSDSGDVRWGVNIDKGYYEQQHQSLRGGTILDTVWEGNRTLSQTQVRNALGAMLFSGEEVFKNTDTLSGGEKARVALCKLAISGSNVLLLDEPTNHLDMTSREVLEEALSRYEGTLIAVSHDRYFINKIANRLWVLENGGLIDFIGNYDQYLAAKAQAEEVQDAQPAMTRTQETKLRKQERQEREQVKLQKKQLQQLEDEISTLEKRQSELEGMFADTSLYSDAAKLRAAQEEYEQVKILLEQKMEEWAEQG